MSVMLDLKTEVDIVLLTDRSVSIRSSPLLTLHEPHFPHFPSLSLFLFFLLLRSECLLRAATAMERQSTGLQPIIRKETGMNCKASFH